MNIGAKAHQKEKNENQCSYFFTVKEKNVCTPPSIKQLESYYISIGGTNQLIVLRLPPTTLTPLHIPEPLNFFISTRTQTEHLLRPKEILHLSNGARFASFNVELGVLFLH